jgi:hypothetical protein
MGTEIKTIKNVYYGVMCFLPHLLPKEGEIKTSASEPQEKRKKDKVPTTYFAVPGRGTKVKIF